MNARSLLWPRDLTTTVSRTTKWHKGLITWSICFVSAALGLFAGWATEAESTVDLAGATVVIRSGELPKAERSAAQVLLEELEKRIGRRLQPLAIDLARRVEADANGL
jgi:hypothetical protein